MAAAVARGGAGGDLPPPQGPRHGLRQSPGHARGHIAGDGQDHGAGARADLNGAEIALVSGSEWLRHRLALAEHGQQRRGHDDGQDFGYERMDA